MTLVLEQSAELDSAVGDDGAPSNLRWALLAVSTILLLSMWAISSPIGSSPDDDFHLASIWCGNGPDDELCRDGGGTTRFVPAEFVGVADCFRFKPWEAASCQNVNDDWGSTSLSSTDHVNSSGLYPPVYFRSMHIFASSNTRRSALLARFGNVVLAVSGFGLAVASTSGRLRQAVLTSTLLGSMPLGLFLLASNNPSAWSLIGAASIWGPYYSLCMTDTGRRRALAVATVLLAAVLATARADSAIYVPLILGSVGIASGHWRRIVTRPNWVVLGTGIAATAISFGAVASASQSRVAATGFEEEAIVSSASDLYWYNVTHLHELFGGLVGIGWGLGWLDTTATPVAGGLVIASLALFLVSKRFTGTADEYIGIIPLWGALIVFPLLILQLGNNVVGDQLQPRYLLPLFPPFLGLIFAAQRAPFRRVEVFTKVFMISALSLAHASQLHRNIRRYVTGTDFGSLNLNAGIEWWWPIGPSPMVVWALGCVAYIGVAVAVLALPVSDGSPVRHTMVSDRTTRRAD